MFLSIDPDVIDAGYEIRANVEHLSSRARSELSRVLGTLNNYDPYINIRGIKAKKSELLEIYGDDNESDRETRYALSVVEVLDIYSEQDRKEGKKGVENKEGKLKLTSKGKSGFGIAMKAMKSLLKSTGSEERFNAMGFSVDTESFSYQTPELHPVAPEVFTLSKVDGEHAFIAIHQAFEVLFEEAIINIKAIRENSSKLSSAERVAHIQDIATLLASANKLYATLRPLMTDDEFNTMRAYFGVASGAQSQQYHRLQFMIGLPNGDVTPEDRSTEIELLIGKRNMDEIKEEVSESPSLRSIYNTTHPTEDEARALRELDIAFLEFKAVHGNAMLLFLPNHAIGTAGSNITKFFVDVMHPTFEEQFSAEELKMVADSRKKALHIVNDNLSNEDVQFVEQKVAEVQGDITKALDEISLRTSASRDGMAALGAIKGLLQPFKKHIEKLETVLGEHFIQDKEKDPTDKFVEMMRTVKKLRDAGDQITLRDAS